MKESKKQKKINKVIIKELSEIFRKQCSESLIKQVIISVILTKISADLRTCKVYLSIYPKEYSNKIFSEINENKSIYYKYIAKKLKKTLRIIPILNFFLENYQMN